MAKPPEHNNCPVYTTLKMISGKWKPLIFYHLKDGKRRYNYLHRSIAGISQRILTLHLRELEAYGLIERKVYAEVPPRVEYSLTSLGESLIPVLENLADWEDFYRNSSANESLHSYTIANPLEK